MHLLIVEPSAVPGNWEWMRELLASAIEYDDERDEGDVLADLVAGNMSAFGISGEIDGMVVTQQTGPWFWVIYAAGKVQNPVFENMSKLMRAFEAMAIHAGCEQIHMIGRKGWVRALKAMNYEHFGDVRGRAHIRKVL